MLQNAPVTTRLMAVDDAIASGARALFGEKYGDEVRVVAMGEGRRQCAGLVGRAVRRHPCAAHRRHRAHLGASARAGVAAGVRRLEALTGTAARKSANHMAQLAKAAAAELKVPLEDVPGRLAQVLDERKRLERELSDAKKKLAMGGGGQSRRRRRRAHGRRREAAGARGRRASTSRTCKQPRRRGQEAGRLRRGRDRRRHREDGKAGIVVGVTPDLTARFSAVDLVRKGAEALGGKGGGGRPDMAQAGGPDGAKADAALAAIAAALGG